ncbi:MAG: Ig-like domain-containing protein, partial [Muribaculaceae bacterium]|nr:Ig-like domain-containing protein [Muribaculaceae bacterium]
NQKFNIKMKKFIIAFLCLLMLTAVSASAVEKSYTLTFKDNGSNTDGNELTGNIPLSTVIASGTDYVSSISSTTKIYLGKTNCGLKLGTSSAAGSITFSLSEKGKVKATKIVLNCAAYNSNKSVNIDVNGLDSQTLSSTTFSDVTFTFTAATDITELQIKTTKYSYVKSLTVFYEEDSGLLPAGLAFSETTASATLGSEFTEPTLTKATDAAVTYASSDESVATVDAATGAVTLIAGGTTTITASAEATETYAAGEASYVLTVIQAYQTLGDWIAAKPETACPVTTPATAVFQWGATPESNQYLYITDGTSWMLVYGKFGQTYTNGDVVPAGYAGKYTTYNGLPEMAPAEGAFLAATEQVDPVQPTEMSIGSITTANINQYVKLKNVDITNLNNKTATITDGTNSIELYNNFSLTVSAQENATVIGFVSYYEKNSVTKLQIYPTEIIEGAIKPVVTVSPGSGAVESGTTVDVTVTPADATIYYMTTTTEVWPEEWTAYDAENKPTITEACSYKVKAESAQEAGLFSDEVTCEYTITIPPKPGEKETKDYVWLSYNNKVVTDSEDGTWQMSASAGSDELPAVWTNEGASSRGVACGSSLTITSNSYFKGVTEIVIEYSSNAATNKVDVYVGDVKIGDQIAVAKKNHQQMTLTSDLPLSGNIKIEVTRTGNTVWIGGVRVTTSVDLLMFSPGTGNMVSAGEEARINIMSETVANVSVSINKGEARDNYEIQTTESGQRYIVVPITGEDGTFTIDATALDEDDQSLGEFSAEYNVLNPKYYRQVMDNSHVDFDADYVLMYTKDASGITYLMSNTMSGSRFNSKTDGATFAYDVVEVSRDARQEISVITFEPVGTGEPEDDGTILVYVKADGKYLTCSTSNNPDISALDEPAEDGRSVLILSIDGTDNKNIKLEFKYTIDNPTEFKNKTRELMFNPQGEYWAAYVPEGQRELSKLYIAADKLPVRHFGKIIDFVNYADAYIDEFPRVVPQEGAAEAVQGDNGVGPKGLWAIDSDMTVVYADNVLHGGRDVFVQDETGGLMLYEKDILEEKVVFAEGDVLHGIQGQIDCTTQGVPRLLLTGFDETAHSYTSGEDVPEAMEITIAQLADNNNNILHNGKAVKLGYITADFTELLHSEGDEKITNYNADGENFHYVIGNGLTKKEEDNVHVVLRHHTIEGVLSSDEFGYNTDELWPNSGNGEGGGSPITVIRRDGTQTVVDNLFEIVGVAYNNIKSKLIYAFGLTKSGAPVLEAPQFGGGELGNGRYALDMVHDFADICDFYYITSSDPSVTDVDPTTATKFTGHFIVDLNVTPYVHAVAVLNPTLARNAEIWTPSYDAPGSLWDMASGPSQIVRRDGETTVKTAKSLVATFKEGTPLGIDEMMASNVNILPVSGGVRVVGYDGLLRVFSISGMELVNATIHGDTYVELPAGMVIVVTEPVSAKVLVK